MSKRNNKKNGLINFLANLIWIIFGGLITSIGWLLIGLILCITIIGIPFGLQCFKLASVSLAPFGKSVDINFGKHPIMNLVWAIFVGWELFLGYMFAGLILCITIIGIPFGIKIFRFATVGLFPFGANIH